MDPRKVFLLIIIIVLLYVKVLRQPEPVEITGTVSQTEPDYPLHSEEKPLSPIDFIKGGLSRPKPRPTPSNGS